MSPARRLALTIVRLTRLLLPAPQASWSRAMVHEVAQVDDDAEALRFAMGCFWAAVVQAAAHHLHGSGTQVRSGHHHEAEARPMEQFRSLWRNPPAIGLACAIGAVGLGLVYLAAAQAPWIFIVVNGTALLLGLVAYAALVRANWGGAGPGGAIVLALAAILIGTALFGASADGAARWIRLGPLSVQVSLLFLPTMILLFARHRDAAGTAGLILAAFALALQPDRAMAGVLVAGLLALAMSRFDLRVGLALLAAATAFAVTLVRPDTSLASPYVDQILYTSFDVHPLVGVAVLTGALLLIVPAIHGLATCPARWETYAAFGMVWLGIIVAAALGNSPTPLVGYGGSAVLGYVLSLASTAPMAGTRRVSAVPGDERPQGHDTVRRSLHTA